MCVYLQLCIKSNHLYISRSFDLTQLNKLLIRPSYFVYCARSESSFHQTAYELIRVNTLCVYFRKYSCE